MIFYPPPELVLEDLDSLLAFLENPPENVSRWRVKAILICNLIEKIFSEKGTRFEYNDSIRERARTEFGFSHLLDDALGILVYNAQAYVEHDYLVREGYEPFTQELIERAGEQGLAIQFFSGTISSPKLKPIEDGGEKWFAWVPSSRTRAFQPNPQTPVRLKRKDTK